MLKNILNKKKTILITIIVSDFILNCFLQQSYFKGKTNYYFYALCETNVTHVFTSFLLLWAIWYGPIILLSYIISLIYEKHCKINKTVPVLCLSTTLRFYVEWSITVFGCIFLLVPVDLFVFVLTHANACIWPDLIFYNANVYHIIDVFLFVYAIVSYKTYSRILLNADWLINGWTIYFCVILVILPAILFSFPFIWTDVYTLGYTLRLDYLKEITTLEWKKP